VVQTGRHRQPVAVSNLLQNAQSVSFTVPSPGPRRDPVWNLVPPTPQLVAYGCGPLTFDYSPRRAPETNDSVISPVTQPAWFPSSTKHVAFPKERQSPRMFSPTLAQALSMNVSTSFAEALAASRARRPKPGQSEPKVVERLSKGTSQRPQSAPGRPKSALKQRPLAVKSDSPRTSSPLTQRSSSKRHLRAGGSVAQLQAAEQQRQKSELLERTRKEQQRQSRNQEPGQQLPAKTLTKPTVAFAPNDSEMPRSTARRRGGAVLGASSVGNKGYELGRDNSLNPNDMKVAAENANLKSREVKNRVKGMLKWASFTKDETPAEQTPMTPGTAHRVLFLHAPRRGGIAVKDIAAEPTGKGWVPNRRKRW